MKLRQRDEQDPERWTALGGAAPLRGAVGVALRHARDATVPTDADVARLDARLAALTERPAARPWHWRLALAALLLLSTGGVVGAAGLLLRRAHQAPPPHAARPVAVVVPAREAQVGHAPRVGGAVAIQEPQREPPSGPPSEPPAALSPAAATSPTLPPPERTAARSRAPLAPAARPAPVTEAALLAGAFRALRTDQDAAAALRALDGYDKAFPDGVMAAEARVARAEALMAQGRRAAALSVLETFDDAKAPPTRNVLVMRGELLAESGRCARAVRDFDGILRTDARGDAEARALFGRGACRLRQGNGDGDGAQAAGRQDLRRYLQLYPGGPFAAAARAALSP